MDKMLVYLCMTSRDGCIDNDVREHFVSARDCGRQAGIQVGSDWVKFGHGTAVCRNEAVAKFLATKATHLMFVDDDVLLQPESVVWLAESAQTPGVDIVCGAYPTYKFTDQGAYLYLTARPDAAQWLQDWPQGLLEINAGGTGCMLIRRAVFESVGFPWFRWPEQHNRVTGAVDWMSDDVDFCIRAREQGFRVWCDGRVQPGHLKKMDLKLLMNGVLRWRETIPEDDGYGSHVGALKLVAQNVPIRTVVEYGSGKFSTSAFLDRAVFPDLEQLLSFETDANWMQVVRGANPDDRLTLTMTTLDAIHTLPVPAADLVFIDCDSVRAGGNHDYTARTRLIAKHAADPHGVVVVHDANFTDIRPAILAAPFKFKATYVPPAGPHTALLSNVVDVLRLKPGGAA